MPFFGLLLISSALVFVGSKLRRDGQRRDAILMAQHPDDPFWDVAEVSFEQATGEGLMMAGGLLLVGSFLGRK